MPKSTPDEIRQRFDRDVERFSNLETGQSATIDAPLVLDLITSAALAVTPHAQTVLDVGCGAGNYPLKLLQKIENRPAFDITLIDLSRPMLDRAAARLTAAAPANSPPSKATCVKSHLEKTVSTSSWLPPCCTICEPTRSGKPSSKNSSAPSVPAAHSGFPTWSSTPPAPSINSCGSADGEYLTGLNGEAYRDQVFAYIEKEDTPRSLVYQLDLLRRVGFSEVEPLHKNGPFAAFGAVKAIT